MNTILNNVNSEYKVKNSTFITFLFYIENPKDIEKHLNLLKTKYPDATHYCYAYRTINSQKASDDNEPKKTAGIPILQVLIKKDLVNVLAVVIRYFGGIKLGANGLVRAYSKAVSETIKLVQTKKLEKGYLIEIIFTYDKQKSIDLLLKDQIIIDKNFQDKISYQAKINQETLENLKANNIDFSILDEIYL